MGYCYYQSLQGGVFLRLHRFPFRWLAPVLCDALLAPSLSVHADWVYEENAGTLRYEKDDGTFLISTFQKINGHTYYFDSDGTVHTGWLSLNGKRYFFDESGAMLCSQWVGDKYLKKNGEMARNCWVANHTAYVGKNGSRIATIKKYKAKFIKTARGVKYRNADGTFSAKTWQCIKGHWYYFYSTGYMAKSTQLGEYYVNNRGWMVTNKTVKIGKYRYQYGPDGRLIRRTKIKKAKKKD